MNKDDAVQSIDSFKHALEGLLGIARANDAKAEEINKHYEELRTAAVQPYLDKKEQANQTIGSLLDDPRALALFATFKPGDFCKRGSEEWLEVVGLDLTMGYRGEPNVRLRCYEIKWDGSRHRYPTTLDQDRATKVDEYADKRLLKRVKKRVIERLEASGSPFATV